MPTGELETIETLCDNVVNEHSARDELYDTLEDYYFQENEKDPTAEHEQEGIEIVCLPHGPNAVELVQDLLSDAELTITVPAKKDTDAERALADEAEAYCQALLHDSQRAQQQTVVSLGAWMAAMRGCIGGRVLPLPSFMEAAGKGRGAARKWFDGKSRLPLALQLRDPRYLYPAFERDGLAYMVEQWARPVRDVRRTYGDDALPNRDDAEEVQWREYWDDKRSVYWADGDPVEIAGESGITPHDYGEIPYFYSFARQTAKLEPEKRVRPLLGTARHTIDLMDTLDSMDLTFIKQYIGTAWAITYQGETKPKVSLGVGDKVFLKPDEKIEPIQGGRRVLELDQFRDKVSVMQERATFPGTVYGEDPGRLVAGYAISLLNQSGQMKLRPIIMCLEQFLGGILAKALMVSQQFIAIQTAQPIPFWTVEEKESKAGKSRVYRSSRKLDAKKLEGVYSATVQIGDVLPVDEVTNFQLATQSQVPGANGRPLLSWQTAMEKFGIVSDTTQERQRIEREAAWTDPEIRLIARAIAVAETKEALLRKAAEIGVDTDEVLMRAQMEAQGVMPQPQAPLPGPVPEGMEVPGMGPEGMEPPGMGPEGMPMGPEGAPLGPGGMPPGPEEPGTYDVQGGAIPWGIPPGPGEEEPI